MSAFIAGLAAGCAGSFVTLLTVVLTARRWPEDFAVLLQPRGGPGPGNAGWSVTEPDQNDVETAAHRAARGDQLAAYADELAAGDHELRQLLRRFEPGRSSW